MLPVDSTRPVYHGTIKGGSLDRPESLLPRDDEQTIRPKMTATSVTLSVSSWSGDDSEQNQMQVRLTDDSEQNQMLVRLTDDSEQNQMLVRLTDDSEQNQMLVRQRRLRTESDGSQTRRRLRTESDASQTATTQNTIRW
ncbi:hypothetical protein J6590_054774 [Homalodisca vitripennis]|nr:hypothetical protein J6590_054774 [Homalodisca vitripennis]